MSSNSTAPYGQWDSLITSDTVISTNIVFDDVLVDPITNVVYHLEERPDDNGRCVIVDTYADKDVLPSPYSARDSVQEYGGAPAIVYDGIIYFSNDSGDASNPDNGIYAINLKDESVVVRRVTPVNPKWRYANFAVHSKETHLLVAIREDHTDDTPQTVINTLCVVDTNTASVTILIDGADFYAAPVFNSSGNKIGWQEWYLPDMPFEGALIYVADVAIDNGTIVISNTVPVAGEKVNISAGYPSWITDTTLVYTSDGVNQFQNPFIYSTETEQSTSVLETTAAQDFSEPAWTLGLYPYAILDGGKYGAFTAFEGGRNVLYVIDLAEPSKPIAIENFDFTVAQHLRPVGANTFVFTGSKSAEPGGVILGTISGSSGSYTVEFNVLKPSGVVPAELQDFISPPVPMTLRDPSNPLYVVYYAPKNPNYSGSSIPDEKPPCIVGVHGGPTGLEPQALSWTKMFYTSRGFAWLDVNYRGSSGYGREYIERLTGQWGIYDIEDCKIAPSILAAAPYSYIDGKRVAIRGGSAGGYATLASLTIAPDTTYFKAATSAYGGISDLIRLAQITEKFELQYMYKLLGGSPVQIQAVYTARSPIDNVSNPETGIPNISVPLLMLQGEEDAVVPPTQAHQFLDKITQEAPQEYVESKFYPGEGHHWHLASTIKDALEREHAWYENHLL